MAPARRRWPRRCCSPPGRSAAGRAGRGRQRRCATSTPRRRGAGSRSRWRSRRSRSTATRSTSSTRPAMRTSSVTSRPRCARWTSWCASSPRSKASRCRPRSPGRWPSARHPRVIFVNKLDRERASFDRTLEQLKDRFGAGVAPLELPIGEEGEFRGVIDLLTDTAMIYDGSLARRHAGTGARGAGGRGALGARRAHRGHRRRRRRPHGALPRRRDHRSDRARARARDRDRRGDGLPGPVRQRGPAHRRGPARAVHRRGRARRRTSRPARHRRPRSCSRRSSIPTWAGSTCSRSCRAR